MSFIEDLTKQELLHEIRVERARCLACQSYSKFKKPALESHLFDILTAIEGQRKIPIRVVQAHPIATALAHSAPEIVSAAHHTHHAEHMESKLNAAELAEISKKGRESAQKHENKTKISKIARNAAENAREYAREISEYNRPQHSHFIFNGISLTNKKGEKPTLKQVEKFRQNRAEYRAKEKAASKEIDLQRHRNKLASREGPTERAFNFVIAPQKTVAKININDVPTTLNKYYNFLRHNDPTERQIKAIQKNLYTLYFQINSMSPSPSKGLYFRLFNQVLEDFPILLTANHDSYYKPNILSVY